jgi:hypothetical protein
MGMECAIRRLFKRRTCTGTTNKCVYGQGNIYQYIRYMNKKKKQKQQQQQKQQEA